MPTCACRVQAKITIPYFYLSRMASVALLTNLLCSSERDAKRREVPTALEDLWPVAEMMKAGGLVRIPLVILNGFTDTSGQQVEDAGTEGGGRMFVTFLREFVTSKNKGAWHSLMRRLVNDFFMPSALSVFGRKVVVTPLSLCSLHALAFGRLMLLQVMPVECFARDRRIQVCDLDIRKGDQAWDVAAVRLKSLRLQSTGLEGADPRDLEVDPDQSRRKNSTRPQVWEEKGYQSREHYMSTYNRELLTMPFGSRGMLGWVMGDQDVGGMCVIPALTDVINLSAHAGAPDYLVHLETPLREAAEMLVTRFKECYRLIVDETTKRLHRRTNIFTKMMMWEYWYGKTYQALLGAGLDEDEATQSLTSDISVSLAQAVWIPVPSTQWINDPVKFPLDLYQLVRDGSPPLMIDFSIARHVEQKFKDAWELSVKGGKANPDTWTDEMMWSSYGQYHDDKLADCTRIAQAAITVFDVRYDKFLVQSNMDKLYGQGEVENL